MQPSLAGIQSLLIAVQQVADRQAEISRLKGENFNLFSILGMEKAENKTHSAFLGELLNPKGSHGMGDRFLGLFLETIGYTPAGELKDASLTLERYIGVRDDDKKEGGKIDIYIALGDGRTISIENKIYAPDQNTQIERYAKHKTGKNTVYYLTLDGREPSVKSKGELDHMKGHFHCISYQGDILDWLAQCMKEAADQPILRESIKQYMILIQKLTGQMTDHKKEQELKDLIIQNYRAANLIATKIGQVEVDAAYEFMKLVEGKIREFLHAEDGWIITLDQDLSKPFSGLSIGRESWDYVMIKLQGESKIVDKACLFGIVAPKKDNHDRSEMRRRLAPVNALQTGFGENLWWAYYQTYDLFTAIEHRLRLFDKQVIEQLAQEHADKIVALALECKERLAGIPRLKPA